MVVEKKKLEEKKLELKKCKEEMAEWSKAADCKSVEFSQRRFESCFLHLRNITQR